MKPRARTIVGRQVRVRLGAMSRPALAVLVIGALLRKPKVRFVALLAIAAWGLVIGLIVGAVRLLRHG